MKIFKVTLKITNALRDFAENHEEIYVLEKDIDYMFKTYDVEIIEYAGLFFERSK